MQNGKRLFWHGDAGPELEGHPFWPQKVTVRALLKQKRLQRLEAKNLMQGLAGCYEFTLVEEEERQALLAGEGDCP
jgi:hypothetical protein